MKILLTVFTLTTVAFAAPKSKLLSFRNLYKNPSVPITHKLNPRIIGGQEAEPHSIPYQVFLEIYDKSQYGWYCGGALISVNYILTAAHCGDGAIVAYITLGAHKPFENENTQIQAVSKDIKIHEKYDPVKILNDIAVIKLPASVELTDAIQTVSLPSTDSDFAGVRAKASGWGLTWGTATDISEVLEYVQLPVISNKDCGKLVSNADKSILCTSGEENTGPCSGDSGGPLVYNEELIGVVSFGIAFCPVGYPSGFARVTYFKDWILNNTDVEVN